MKILLLFLSLLLSEPGIIFTSSDGVKCRLTARGNGTWRIQGEAKPGAGFNDEGAVQALSSFMGETLDDAALPLRRKGGKTVTAKSPDGSRVQLLPDGSLVFISASGKEVVRIRSIASRDGKTLSLIHI